MTEPTDTTDTNDQHVQITGHGHPLATAEVSTPTDPHGTAHVVLHAESGHLPAGTRAELVDVVLDLPDVQHADHLKAYAPLGDSESLSRIQQRSTDMRTRAAGSTAIVNAELTEPGDSVEPVEPS